jgi:hypothetical protein
VIGWGWTGHGFRVVDQSCGAIKCGVGMRLNRGLGRLGLKWEAECGTAVGLALEDGVAFGSRTGLGAG